MTSIITNNSFTNCKKLKKIYLNPDTIIGSLDLSKTLIKTYQEPERYDKTTSNNAIFANSRVIHQTKFPPQDAGTNTDLTSEEITQLEQKLTQTLAETSSSGLRIGELLGRITGFNREVERRKQELQAEQKQNKDLQAKLASIHDQLNSSQVDKLALENQVKELDNQLERIKVGKVLTDKEHEIVQHLRSFYNSILLDLLFLKENDSEEKMEEFLSKFRQKVLKMQTKLTERKNYPILGNLHYLYSFGLNRLLSIISKYKNELAKERNWWDKWLNDDRDFITSTDKKRDYCVNANFPDGSNIRLANVFFLDQTDLKFTDCNRTDLKQKVKEKIYQYYLNLDK
jgi:hypothetical protein